MIRLLVRGVAAMGILLCVAQVALAVSSENQRAHWYTPPEEPADSLKPAVSINASGPIAWDVASVDARLGASYESLNPGNAADDRPLNFKPDSHACTLSFANRCNPYELGRDGCYMDNDYWSDSGQVAYVPTDPTNDPGLDRIQTFAYYNHVFALSPRLDYASGTPHPDPQTRESTYVATLGGQAPKQPVAMVRNYGMLQNEALVIYKSGLLAVAGTQTSRAGSDRPYPGLLLPANKVPTAIAVTSENEFALITVWDTKSGKGQLAVVALEGKYLTSHTMPYIGFPNEGSFSDLKLLGYVDLPFKRPTAVSAATNGFWGGPSQTASEDLGQIDITVEGTRWGLYSGTEEGWVALIAEKGYALVSSQSENEVAVVDLTPLVRYMRDSYLSSKATQQQTLANRGPGPNQFPESFDVKPEIAPTVARSFSYPAPTAVLAGITIDRWTEDRFKGYVAQEDGTIHILDTTSFMARFDWQKKSALAEMGSLKVGRNPLNMVFTRFGDSNVPLLPKKADGSPETRVDPLNNSFYVVCRGTREVDAVVTWGAQGQVYRRIRDQRLRDPVAVSVATRGNIVSVADFKGQQVLSFRVGGLTDRYGVYYGPGADGRSDYELGGVLPVAGYPFAINSANVN